MKTGKRKFKVPILKIYTILIYIFVYFPLLIVIAFSFSPGATFSLKGVTGKWYIECLKDEALLSAIVHSLEVAGVAIGFAIGVGTAGAFFLNRARFPGKEIIRGLSMLPITLPGIIVGISLLVFFKNIGVELSQWTITVAHMTFTTPLVMIQVLARLERLSKNLELAAMDLGATPMKTFFM